MNHYTLRLVSGRVIDLEAESLYPGIHSSYGEAYRIPFGNGSEYVKTSAVESIVEVPIIPPKKKWDDADLDILYANGMSVRGYNCLKRAGLNTVQDVLDYVEKHGNLQKIRNMGPSCECNIRKAMKDVYGLDMYTGEVTDDT